jgi:hypothetical protein
MSKILPMGKSIAMGTAIDQHGAYLEPLTEQGG